MNKKCLIALFLGLIIVSVLPHAVHGRGYYEGGWTYTAASYFWVPEIEGTVTGRGLEVPISTEFFDFQDNLGGNFHLEAWNSDFGLILDVQYMRWRKTVELGHTFVRASGRVTTVEVSASYIVGDGDLLPEFLVGGRFTNMDNEFFQEDNTKTTADRNWFHPFFGTRVSYPVGEKMVLWMRGDVGGFIFRSDLTWNAASLLEYRFGQTLSAMGGYRIMDVDYHDSNGEDLFRYDVQSRGLVFAFVLRF